MRKNTKIIATISDSRCDFSFIKALIEEGVDAFRLNTAHQTPETSKRVVDAIRKVSSHVAIVLDTKGPEVRTRLGGAPLEVQEGDVVWVGGEPVEDAPWFSTSYERFVEDVPEGARLLIDDGEIGLLVEERKAGRLVCRVENEGVVKDKKSINVPGVHLSLPALTGKDREYVRFAVEEGVDYIAHSFVRSREDVEEVREALERAGGDAGTVGIIAKIENREGVDHAEGILDTCDGLMIARGDLGIEIPAEEVPAIQKRLIRLCMERAKPVITATQLLHSMIENPRPTRAEVTDIATAVLDGTDALMLSGETAYGKYPVEAVKTMVRVASTAEKMRPELPEHDIVGYTNPVRYFLSQVAMKASYRLPIAAIIVHTYTGRTARLVSSFRGKTPVYVFCHDSRVARRLALSYGVYPRVIELPESTDELVKESISSLLTEGDVRPEDLVLILAGSPPHQSNSSNFLEINTVATYLKERG
ncbi:pyruvate kinase [Spirochaeta thermophila]|uniref:Pyruvate kinase n=1 Tax=Winmispira thermophila (strain ATCC 49972 / DSM 6192 / RI 19.B1) TaxID=665571 RepID=E0RU34_WINT6|nr:pyruvate kinase [Spirochaeta thermophila]ADN01090.1 pyruvate kinase [Spirochaeta thermophila DSM 6192]